jgi:hypothetical protein
MVIQAKSLDTASAQPTGQPESIPASLESQNDPSDHSTDFHRMIPPTLHQTQQRRWIVGLCGTPLCIGEKLEKRRGDRAKTQLSI